MRGAAPAPTPPPPRVCTRRVLPPAAARGGAAGRSPQAVAETRFSRRVRPRPLAVTDEPPPPPTRYGVLCCQAILLVVPSIAVNMPDIGEPIGADWLPPV